MVDSLSVSLAPSSTRSPLVGREADLESVRSRIDDGARLITLVGPGGVGKSRLALEIAARFGDRVEGGAVSCDLTRIRDGAGRQPADDARPA